MLRCSLAKKTKEKDSFRRPRAGPETWKEAEFFAAFAEAEKIGKGALGWQGQAEMMVELGLDKALRFGEPKKPVLPRFAATSKISS